MIAKVLIQKNVLSGYTAGVWFIHGLPSSLSAKVMQKYNVDTEDPTTVNYSTIHTYIEKSTTSEKAIQRMHAEKSPDSDWKVELGELVDQFQMVMTVAKEKKLADRV